MLKATNIIIIRPIVLLLAMVNLCVYDASQNLSYIFVCQWC